MSATANSLRDPRLLPGVSAFTWSRISLIAYLVGLIVWIPLFLALALNGFRNSSAGVLAVILPLILLPTIVGLISRLRQSSEKAAGYATILTSGSQLDLLDVHSGTVLWRAGEPPLRAVGLVRTFRGEQASASLNTSESEPAFPRKATNAVFRLLGFFAGLIFVVVVFSVTHRTANIGAFALTYLACAAFGGLILLLVFALTRLTIGRRIRVLSALRPNAMIFTSVGTGPLTTALAALGIVRGRNGRFPVVVTDSAMEFWDATGDAPWGSIPWGGVTRVDPDSAAIGNNVFRAVALTLDHSGTPITATLPIYGRQGIFTASSSWANQVFDEIRFHLAKRPTERPSDDAR